MPLFDLHLDNGDIVTVKHPQMPTAEESQALINSLNAPQSPTPVANKVPSESDQIAQQYIAQQQRPALQKLIEAAINPVRGGFQMAGDIAGIVPGIAESTAPNAQSGTTLRSLIEGSRRAGTGFINLAREIPSNAINATLPGLIKQALQLGSRTPSQSEVEQAVLEQLTQQNTLRPENQILSGQISEKLAQGTSQAIPLVLPFVGAAERAAALQLAGQGLKTAATIASSPVATAYQAAKAAQPYFSGRALSGAQAGVEAATARQSALDNSIQQSLIKEQAATQGAIQGVSEARRSAAVKGREALAAGRELKTAEGTIAPEIVQAQANLESAAQLPPVILGTTATEPAAFGRNTLKAIEGPMKASEEAIQTAYTAVEESLPAKQQALEAKPLFKAAQESKGELSQGFEAYNKGEIKRILDETTRLTPVESTVPQSLRDLYNTEGINPNAKAALLKQYPQLAQESAATIPKYTWTELQTRFRQVNQGINQALKYGNVNDARILENLKQGINASMDAYASKVGGDTLDLFKNANTTYAEHQNKFGLNRIQTLFKDDIIQNPEFVADKLIHYTNPSQVEALKAIVSPEEFAPVQAQFARQLFSPASDVAFDPAHFVKQFSKHGIKETVQAVFGDQGVADFNRINEASKSFAKIGDLQKTLDTLASQSEKTTAAFTKAKGAATDAQKILSDKNALKAQLKPLEDAKLQAQTGIAQADVDAALKELDRVKNYRDLKDWGTRVSGLNILETALDSQAGVNLLANAGLILEKNSTPKPKRSK